MGKIKQWMLGVALAVICMNAWHYRTVIAQCQGTSSNGSDQVVICTDPVDPKPVITGAGNDRVTVESGVTMKTADTAIDTGAGHDRLYQRGAVFTTSGDTLEMRSGSDIAYNYGTLNSADDGIGCAPLEGEVCRIYNFRGASITAVMEAIDYRTEGGSGYIYNTGTIRSTTQEALHLHLGVRYDVINFGEIYGVHSAIEMYQSQAYVVNAGIVSAKGMGESAINFDIYNDTLLNIGTITDGSDPAISAGAGDDIINNQGTITAMNDEAEMSVIEGDDGNDLIINSGTIKELGVGHAAIEGGHGSDTIVVKGGLIQGLITGDHDAGTREGDHDILIFQLIGSKADLDAFREAIAEEETQHGSATWQGKTYRWQGFEEILINPAKPNGSSGGGSSDCPPGAPPGIDALRTIVLDDPQSFEFQWQDISDPCMGVTSYMVRVATETFDQTWTFKRSEIDCHAGVCAAEVTLPQPLEQFYWSVRATNKIGTGSSAKSLRYQSE